jgi:methionyl-tRNA formyltransferase
VKRKILLLTDQKSKKKIYDLARREFSKSIIECKIFSKIKKKERLNNKYNSYDFIFNFRSFFIFNKRHLNLAKISAINFHPSPPKYRGRGGINYALFNKDKIFGVTTHIIDEKIDHGKILKVNYFKIPKKCNVHKLFQLTQKNLFELAKITFKEINKNDNSIEEMIKNSQNIKWSKKLYQTRDLNKFYKINIRSGKKNILRKIIATKFGKFNPYIEIYGIKFYYN